MQVRLLWISGGDQDGLIDIGRGLHAYLKSAGVPQIRQVDHGGHYYTVWKSDLYHYSQMIFK